MMQGDIKAEAVDEIFLAGLDCMQHGNLEGAIENFEAALKAEPSHAEARHGLIRALEDAGRFDEALSATQTLIAEAPDDVLAMTRLSMIYQHQGMVSEAEAAAAKAKILGWKQELRSGVSPGTDLN